MEKSMTDCGLDPKEKSNIFRITAAVLHIGNIVFEEVADGCKPNSESEASASGVAAMLGLDRDALMQAIAYKSMNIGGTESQKALSMIDTKNNRNAFAKSLYSKLFDWIVEMPVCVNASSRASLRRMGLEAQGRLRQHRKN